MEIMERINRKEMGNINWNDSAEKISNLVRGMSPWPSAYTKLNGKMLKVWKAKPQSSDDVKAAPGVVTSVSKDSFAVMTGDGFLEITEIQLEGKKRMTVKDFLLGYSINSGDKLE